MGIPAAGQSLLEGETLVGHCVNFLPLRSSFAGDPSVASVLTQVKGTLLDAYEHQNYTYGSLVRKLALPRDPSRLPLVEVQFNLERVGAGWRFQGSRSRSIPNPKSFVNFDLFLNVVESDRGLVIDCDYNRDLFDRRDPRSLAATLPTILEEMAADPRTIASRAFPWSMRRNVIDWWSNGTRPQSEFPREKCVHQLFEEQAARNPQSIAAAFEGNSLLPGTRCRRQPAGTPSPGNGNRPGEDRGDLLGPLPRMLIVACSGSSRPAEPMSRSIPAIPRTGFRA